MGFLIGFAVPAESSVSKVDVYAEAVIEWFPYGGYLLALRDGVGGNESSMEVCALHILGSLEVPASYIVNFASSFVGFSLFIDIDGQHIGFLLFGLVRIADKRRISHNEGALVCREYFLPVSPQGVVLVDIGVGLEGQKIPFKVNNGLCLLHHLALGDPKGSLSHRNSKVIDFYAVELADTNFDGVDDGSHDDLGTLQFLQDFIFQTAQGNIAFCEEVAGATGGVEELEGGQLFLKCFQFLFAGRSNLLLLYILELGA